MFAPLLWSTPMTLNVVLTIRISLSIGETPPKSSRTMVVPTRQTLARLFTSRCVNERPSPITQFRICRKSGEDPWIRFGA